MDRILLSFGCLRGILHYVVCNMAQPRRKAQGAPKWLRGGRVTWSEIELARLVAQGIPTSVLADVVELGVLTREEVTRLIVPRRTLAHRKRRRERLSPDESDRLARVLLLRDIALRTFDDAEKAGGWLRTPNRALSGEIPLGLVVTSIGARLVEDALLRIEHGVYT
jgi:putative toxin-antitoxin system antitoxin component (TIGR02293 family)